MVEINIDKDKCVGCGSCVETCPVSIYGMNGDKAEITGNVDDCVLCRACEAACPVSAIEIVE